MNSARPQARPARLLRAVRARLRRLVRGKPAEQRPRPPRPPAVPAAARPAARPAKVPEAATGLVETFERGQLTGWVQVPRGARPAPITLCVNNVEVARTTATDRIRRRGFGDVRGFRLALRDLWQYCRPTDRVTVRVGGRPVPIAGRGMYLRPHRTGEHTLAELQAKFAGGYLFGQKGRLQLSKTLDTEWQRGVLALYEQVRAVVHARFGYDAFICYGTLLGAVRDNGFIGHDLDFDAAYVSDQTDPAVAARELRDIGLALVESGLWVRCRYTALHIYLSEDSDTRIDLFHLFFDAAGELAFPFGVAGTTTVRRDDWAEPKEIDFAGGRVAVPNDPEAMAEHIYGASWRTPKPGFSWTLDRTNRASKGILPGEYLEDVYWANFYAHTEPIAGSPFCAAVLDRTDLPQVVIDLGCGDGRDSVAFGVAGRSVLGIDRSDMAVQHAGRAAAGHGVSDRVRFVACDVSDPSALRTVLADELAGRSAEPVLYYARFFLHSIPEDVQDALLTLLAELARPGDAFAAEFRTDKDAENPKVFGKHYRRFQNAEVFATRLHEDYGFTIVDQQQGTGLSPYRDEDPELYRVVAIRR
jgi:hypothetical protein